MKMDGGVYGLHFSRRMLRLFHCLGDGQYTKSNLWNLIVMRYHRSQSKLPFHRLVMKDIALMDEECGELAFSVLSRHTVSDHVHNKREHMDKIWKTLDIVSRNQGNMDRSPIDTGSKTRTRPHIAKKSPEVIATTNFFKRKLRELERGAFTFYLNADAYKSGKHVVPAARYGAGPVNTIDTSVSPDAMKKLILATKKKFPWHWAEDYADIMGYVLPRAGVPVDQNAPELRAFGQRPMGPLSGSDIESLSADSDGDQHAGDRDGHSDDSSVDLTTGQSPPPRAQRVRVNRMPSPIPAAPDARVASHNIDMMDPGFSIHSPPPLRSAAPRLPPYVVPATTILVGPDYESAFVSASQQVGRTKRQRKPHYPAGFVSEWPSGDTPIPSKSK